MSDEEARPNCRSRLFTLVSGPFRAQARFIARRLDGEAQMALGSFCADTAVPLFFVGFIVDEPFIVYQMSAGALLFTGLGFIASGQAILEAQKGNG